VFVGTVVYALINSVILLLMAIGFNLTFGISGVSNFAYGAFYILSAFVTWMLMNWIGVPYFLSAVLSIIFTAFIGADPPVVALHPPYLHRAGVSGDCTG